MGSGAIGAATHSLACPTGSAFSAGKQYLAISKSVYLFIYLGLPGPETYIIINCYISEQGGSVFLTTVLNVLNM